MGTHIFDNSLCCTDDLSILELMLSEIDLWDGHIGSIGDGGDSVGGLGGG